MIIYMNEYLIKKNRKRTPETYMIIYTTEDLMRKKR